MGNEVDCTLSGKVYPTDYHGIPFERILAKYWELNNHGFEPTEGDRDTLTFQLASDLRHICGKSFEWLDQVIPCYDGFPLEEKRQKIKNALASKYEGMPPRLRTVLDALENKGHVTKEPSPCYMIRTWINRGYVIQNTEYSFKKKELRIKE